MINSDRRTCGTCCSTDPPLWKHTEALRGMAICGQYCWMREPDRERWRGKLPALCCVGTPRNEVTYIDFLYDTAKLWLALSPMSPTLTHTTDSACFNTFRAVLALFSTSYCSMAAAPSSSSSGRAVDSDRCLGPEDAAFLLPAVAHQGASAETLPAGLDAARRSLPRCLRRRSHRRHSNSNPSSEIMCCGADVLVSEDVVAAVAVAVTVVNAAADDCVSGREAVPTYDSHPNTTRHDCGHHNSVRSDQCC